MAAAKKTITPQHIRSSWPARKPRAIYAQPRPLAFPQATETTPFEPATPCQQIAAPPDLRPRGRRQIQELLGWTIMAGCIIATLWVEGATPGNNSLVDLVEKIIKGLF